MTNNKTEKFKELLSLLLSEGGKPALINQKDTLIKGTTIFEHLKENGETREIFVTDIEIDSILKSKQTKEEVSDVVELFTYFEKVSAGNI